MSKIIDDANRLINHFNSVVQTGAEAVQGQTDPPPTIGIFAKGFPEWTADGGTEETGHITQYNGIAYQCINSIQRYEHWAPDLATNNYNPYPAPDADGVYPYVYGMGVSVGMKERNNGEVYTAVQAMTKQVNPPSELPAVFVKEE